MDNNHSVMLRLNVGQVNRLLGLLGTHPYNVAADIIHAIKGQGDAQIAAATAETGVQNVAVPIPVADDADTPRAN